jgi:uncharacterized membrane protein
MSSSSAPSWLGRLVGACLAILASAVALKVAADLLLAALPVLLPTVVGGVLLVVGWRWWRDHPPGW